MSVEEVAMRDIAPEPPGTLCALIHSSLNILEATARTTRAACVLRNVHQTNIFVSNSRCFLLVIHDSEGESAPEREESEQDQELRHGEDRCE